MPPVPSSLKGAELKKKLVEIASTVRPDQPLDIYVTSSTGHQIREDGAAASWHKTERNRKLKGQFSTSNPTVGAKRKASEITTDHDKPTGTITSVTATAPLIEVTTSTTQSQPPKQIFQGCTVYINGNTSASGISDIELKRLLSSHGATVSYHLGRREVTHVILTDPSAPSASSSSSTPIESSSATKLSKTTISSGRAILASRKLELEMRGRVKSKIHYVTVDWVLSSVKDSKRLAETKFPVVPLRDARQGTLASYKKVKSSQLSSMDMMKKT